MDFEKELERLKSSRYFPLDHRKSVGGYGVSILSQDYFDYCVKIAQHTDLFKPGMWLEFGVYQGHTLLELSKHKDIVYGFDSFSGLPENWVKSEKDIIDVNFFDMKGQPPKCLLNKKGIHLIIGKFQDTLEGFLQTNNESCSLIHIDCDLYSSTKYVLDTLISNNRIQRGTVIMFDEIHGYDNYKEHEMKALLESRFKYKYFAHSHQQAAIFVE